MNIFELKDGQYAVKAREASNPYNRTNWECFESLAKTKKYYNQLN